MRASLRKTFSECRIQQCIQANACLREDTSSKKIDCVEECCRVHKDVVLITVLTRKVICVLLFDTYNKDKIELSLRHYCKKKHAMWRNTKNICMRYIGASSRAFRKRILKDILILSFILYNAAFLRLQ